MHIVEEPVEARMREHAESLRSMTRRQRRAIKCAACYRRPRVAISPVTHTRYRDGAHWTGWLCERCNAELSRDTAGVLAKVERTAERELRRRDQARRS